MRCTACAHDNRATARFCEACGARLPCDAEGPGPQERADGERRIVSVLFCDLVGSTLLAERLDPEDLRDLMRGYHGLCSVVVRQQGGHLKQYLGDGVLAYFGYPVAQENDARAAVAAGLEIVDAVGRVPNRTTSTRGLRLSARVAIHSGLVVVGDMGGAEDRDPLTVVGATPNIAAHLQATAKPDTVVISDSTRRLCLGFFETRDTGLHEIRGMSAPMRVFEVRGKSGLESRLEVAAASGLTPLVGRVSEIEQMLACWRRAEEGEGRLVVVGGEAGIGKSRLAHELRKALKDRRHAVIEARCSGQHRQTAFYPLVELLRRAWSLDRRAAADDRFETLVEALRRFSLDVADAPSLLASLLSIPLPDSVEPLNLSPKLQRERTLELMLSLLGKIAAQRPLLLIVEDLHWIDPSTLEFLERLFARLCEKPARMLVLVTHRPAFQPAWPAGERVTRLSLGRLDGREATWMCELVAGGKALPEAVLSRLREKTDGIPLYVEELTKMVLELGVLREAADHFELEGPVPDFAIPETLQESLMARLDRLAPVKDVLQVGAALGRTFSYPLLLAVAGLGEGVVRAEIERLVEAELLRQDGEPPNERFSFKHALLREAAYESLLKSRRREVHRRIAVTIQREFPAIVEAEPEVLAHHYEEAALLEEAVEFLQRAGQAALKRSADAEAASHFTRGLELIEEIPESPRRTERELALYTELGVALMPLKGYAAPEVEAVFSRARALCERSGETRQLFSTLAGLGYFHQSRAELRVALDLAGQRLELARRLGDPSLEMQAHEAVGTVSYWIGAFEEALRHLELGNALYDPARHQDLAHVYGQDPGVVFRAYGAQVLWFLGRADEALRQSRDSLRLARELRHPNSLALATAFAAALRMVRGEPELAIPLAEDAIALAREQRFPFWLGYGMIIRGWALALLGSPREGRAQLLEGMSSYAGTGAQLGGRFCIANLASVHRLCGDLADATGALDAALPTLDKNEDRFWEAEVHRIRGELHLDGPQPEPDLAAACFERALRVSREQGTRALELRAATSLTRLQHTQGRSTDARPRLSRLLSSLTQGADTLDLREAHALLEQLS